MPQIEVDFTIYWPDLLTCQGLKHIMTDKKHINDDESIYSDSSVVDLSEASIGMDWSVYSNDKPHYHYVTVVQTMTSLCPSCKQINETTMKNIWRNAIFTYEVNCEKCKSIYCIDQLGKIIGRRIKR